jgi:hypothetical protein
MVSLSNHPDSSGPFDKLRVSGLGKDPAAA